MRKLSLSSQATPKSGVIALGKIVSKSTTATAANNSKNGCSDSEDYYPSLSKAENNFYFSNMEEGVVGGVPSVPLVAPTSSVKKSSNNNSNESIYANLSIKSKSNTSISSKLTEATAAVVAANRGSIKSSIKKNKKAIAAAAAAKAAAAAALAVEKEKLNSSKTRESDYYQIVSANTNTVKSTSENKKVSERNFFKIK